jgi:FtsP/CotA-like multicopper oxidase with cupredoxin domain
MERRTLFSLGLVGSTAAFVSLPALRAQTARPVLTPFMDPLPLPPSPKEFAWSAGQIPADFANLDAEARTYVDESQKQGKAGFFRIRAEVRPVKFHSQLPETQIWGYADDHPDAGPWEFALGPTFRRFLGNHSRFAGTIVRHVNRLPTTAEHRGFGEPHTTVHLHGAHVPFRFDGYPTKARVNGVEFNPVSASGQHFDYAYPLVDPGFISTQDHGVHTERPSTLWYHDHLLDFTAPNVYRGLAGFFLVYDTPHPAGNDPHGEQLAANLLDTGDETEAGAGPNGLRLPSGDHDIPLVLQEKTFDLDGQLVYDLFNTDGFLGEKYLVNGAVQPFLEVKRRKYRFRILNGSNARIYHLFLCDKNGRSFPLTQIATEGGLLSRPVTRRAGLLLGMAERIEVVVDFRDFDPREYGELYLENRMIQRDGRGPDGEFERPRLASRGTQLMKFVLGGVEDDPSRVPSSLRPFPVTPPQEIANVRRRTFEFERTNGQWAINGRLAGDLQRVDANPPLGVGEVWRLVNKSGGWWHPIHVHHEFMRVLRRNGRLPFDGTGPDSGQSVERDGLARKDTILLGPNSEVEVFVKFEDYLGPFVFHCHNMEHEDHQMMARFDVVA